MGATRVVGIVAAIGLAVVGTKWWRGAEPSNWRVAFKEAALQIPFDTGYSPERDTLLPRDLNLPRGLLSLRIAAPRPRDTSRAGGIAFRITSDTAYPRLGIVQGVNYVWKDVVNEKTRWLMIPADPRKPAYSLGVSRHVHPPITLGYRLILARGMTRSGQRTLEADACGECLDDPMSWCTARDTTTRVDTTRSRSSTTLMREMTSYFERNHVSFAPR